MMKQLFKLWFFTMMILLSAYTVLAQEPAGSTWTLQKAEGHIILTRDGKRTVLRDGSSRAQGILLGAKDMVQTGKGLAELYLQSAGTPAAVTLKLSENTSVVLDSLDDGIVLELLYGRLAVQSGDAITVRAGSSEAFFRECDAVIEYASRPGVPQPSLTIHTLEGDGELTANAESETGGTKYPINRAEQLSLEYRVPFAYIERKNLETVRTAAQLEPFTETAEPASQFSSAGSSRGRRIRAGNTIVGILLVGAGAAMQGYSYFSKQGYRYFSNPGPEARDRLFYGGYASLGLGAVFLLGAVLDNNMHAAD